MNDADLEQAADTFTTFQEALHACDDKFSWGLLSKLGAVTDTYVTLLNEVGRLLDVEATLFLVTEAKVDYDAALFRREHGGVAANRFLDTVTSAIDKHCGGLA